MRSFSFLMAIIIVLFAIWFLYLRDTKLAEPAVSSQTTTSEPVEHQPTTTYGKALKYSRDTVNDITEKQNAAIEEAINGN